MNKIYSIVLCFFCLVILSCEKLVTVDPPVSQATETQVFSSDELVLSAVSGAYFKMRMGIFDICNGGATLLGGLSAGELGSTYPDADLDLVATHEMNAQADGAYATSLWAPAYRNIYQFNAILEGLEHSTKVSESLKAQVRGEMLTLRALHYFYSQVSLAMRLCCMLPIIIRISSRQLPGTNK